jgi:hypothetical protein
MASERAAASAELPAVDHPAHYTAHPSGVECIAITEHMGFCLGNAIKYIWRSGLKTADAITDLRKARWYLDREIARLEKLERAPAGEEKQRVTELQRAGTP